MCRPAGVRLPTATTLRKRSPSWRENSSLRSAARRQTSRPAKPCMCRPMRLITFRTFPTGPHASSARVPLPVRKSFLSPLACRSRVERPPLPRSMLLALLFSGPNPHRSFPNSRQKWSGRPRRPALLVFLPRRLAFELIGHPFLIPLRPAAKASKPATLHRGLSQIAPQRPPKFRFALSLKQCIVCDIKIGLKNRIQLMRG